MTGQSGRDKSKMDTRDVTGRDVIIGIDAGTSVIKSVAFDLGGTQIASASLPNRYTMRDDGAAIQPLEQTFADCATTLRMLGERVDNLPARAAALAVTGQGDGTWLIDRDNQPVDDGWLWLDSRAAGLVQRCRGTDGDRRRFAITGTGMNSCQMGSQLAFMKEVMPQMLDRADCALHCKDWLYLKLTGVRASDPSEACFSFGNFRTGSYDEEVIDLLGLRDERRLLPDIVDGAAVTCPLTQQAAELCGLRAGTPVALGCVDVVCTALGAGIYSGNAGAGCSIIGSTGMHMRACPVGDVYLDPDLTGYVMVMPIPGIAAQIQSNMAATLNIDWILEVAADLLAGLGMPARKDDLIGHMDSWIASGRPGAMLFHPYISTAGERGPFVDNAARAGFVGLSLEHRFADLVRAIVEGLGLAARDCYGAMGPVPEELRLTGGAVRSPMLRQIIAAAVGARVRTSKRAEAGAAGAAMIAAVACGIYRDMNACIDEWVTPLLSDVEAPPADLAARYARLYPAYRDTRLALAPVWSTLAGMKG